MVKDYHHLFGPPDHWPDEFNLLGIHQIKIFGWNEKYKAYNIIFISHGMSISYHRPVLHSCGTHFIQCPIYIYFVTISDFLCWCSCRVIYFLGIKNSPFIQLSNFCGRRKSWRSHARKIDPSWITQVANVTKYSPKVLTFLFDAEVLTNGLRTQ